VERSRDQGLPVQLLAEPDGAFYALLAVDPAAAAAAGLSGAALMRRLVLEHLVAAVGGESFGYPANQPVLRLSYGLLGPAELEQALGRLLDGIRALL
jgi:aspartate/methionine/tyrosine aminotransferase